MKLYQRLCNIILYIILIIFIVILLISIIQKKDIRFIFIRMKIKCFRIINKNKLIKNLEEIDSIMKKNNIFYWIGEGTALGSIRENDIIDGDDDIDIGIYEKEFNNKKKVLFKELKKKGFKIGSRKPLQIFKNGHYIDIDITGKNRRCMAYTNYKFKNSCNHFINDIEPFSHGYINNKRYVVPSIKYIKKLYGDKWHIKINKYDNFINKIKRSFINK